jgi:hypothetical protein
MASVVPWEENFNDHVLHLKMLLQTKFKKINCIYILCLVLKFTRTALLQQPRQWPVTAGARA